MAELTKNQEWFNELVGKPIFVHGTQDGGLDNVQKQPEAESQVKHVIEILFFRNVYLTNCFFQN